MPYLGSTMKLDLVVGVSAGEPTKGKSMGALAPPLLCYEVAQAWKQCPLICPSPPVAVRRAGPLVTRAGELALAKRTGLIPCLRSTVEVALVAGEQ